MLLCSRHRRCPRSSLASQLCISRVKQQEKPSQTRRKVKDLYPMLSSCLHGQAVAPGHSYSHIQTASAHAYTPDTSRNIHSSPKFLSNSFTILNTSQKNSFIPISHILFLRDNHFILINSQIKPSHRRYKEATRHLLFVNKLNFLYGL